MDDIDTCTSLIYKFYSEFRCKMSDTHRATPVYISHYPKRTIDVKKLHEVLKVIDKYGDLHKINAETLNVACIIHLYYEDFYNILEYMFNKEDFKKNKKLEYYIIELRLISVIQKDFYHNDAVYKNIDYDYYFREELYMNDYLSSFEKKVVDDLRAKYGAEFDNMTKILIIMYYNFYDKDLTKLDNILLNFLGEYYDEADINGIESWFYGKDREEYIMFLEHYLNNSLNNKKMII